MGKELEYKLSVPNRETLCRILHDAQIAVLADVWEETPMLTTYYDTPDRRISAQHITLRRRLEGDKSILCVKTPTKDTHVRAEWQIEADEISEASIAELIGLGAPKELLYFIATSEIVPVCGAKFLRRHTMLTFSDGSRAELAGDCGYLYGQNEKLDFTELELELYGGKEEQMLRLVHLLCQTYGLHEEPMSKYSRARRLT